MGEIVFFLSFFLLLVVFVFTANDFLRKEGTLSTMLVFSLGVIIYFCLLPLEYRLDIEDDGFYKHAIYADVYSISTFVVFQSALAIFVFWAALRLCKFPDFSLSKKINPSVDFYFLRYFVFCFVFCILYFNELSVSFSGYENVAGLAYSSPVFAVLKYVVLLNFSIIGFLLYKKNKKIIGLGFIFIAFLFGIFSSDKNPMLITILTLAILFGFKKISKIKFFLYLLLFIPVVYVLLVLVFAFSFWRAGFLFSESLLMAFNDFSFSMIDPAGPFISISLIDKIGDYKFGSTYLNNFLLLIPKFIYPDRPPGLAESFAVENITGWVDGQGLGFSPLAEGITNFGYFAFFHFFIMGLLWALFWKGFKYFCEKKYPADLVSLFYKLYGFYLIVISFRLDSLHYIKIVPMYMVFAILSLIVFFKVSHEKSNLDT